MNREEKLKIKAAAERGEQVEVKGLDGSMSFITDWTPTKTPPSLWNWETYEYRVSPKKEQ